MPKCDVCGTHGANYFMKVIDYGIYKCTNCGLEYTYPKPSDELLSEFYGRYTNIRANEKIVRKNAQQIIEHLKLQYGLNANSKILDFGCGNGEFVEECGDNCFGIEFGVKKLIRIKQNLEELPCIEFDFIVMLDVLEHLNEIYVTMNKIVSKLSKGGYIVIVLVDAESDIPYYYKPPEHLTYWTRNSFEIFAQNMGLSIVEYKKYNMFQLGTIYLNRLLSRTPRDIACMIEETLIGRLPEIVEVPTNEVFVVLQKE